MAHDIYRSDVVLQRQYFNLGEVIHRTHYRLSDAFLSLLLAKLFDDATPKIEVPTIAFLTGYHLLIACSSCHTDMWRSFIESDESTPNILNSHHEERARGPEVSQDFLNTTSLRPAVP
jgi:hypothetical protein